MTDVVVKTQEKEVPKFIYAGFFVRLVAFAIDMIVVSSINGLIQTFMPLEMDIYGTITLASIIQWLLTLAYFTLMTYFTNGQTLGKMITNIRVMSMDGARLSLGQVVSRETFGRYVQNKIMPLYLFVGFAPKHQSLMDMLCDTVVVKIEPYSYVLTDEVL